MGRRSKPGPFVTAAALGAALAGCDGVISALPGHGPPGGPGPSAQCATDAPAAASTRVVRLTHAQYRNITRELLGLDATVDPAEGFQTDPTAAGYNNNQDQLLVSGRLGRDYRRAAESLAATAVQSDAGFHHLVPCTPSGDGSACAQQFISGFLRRAYRRPVADAERARYQMLFSRAPMLSPAGADPFRAGVQLVVETALQSPNFLYRVELTRAAGLPGLLALGPHEVAARLALVLWGGLPDATLDAAADAGQLTTAEQVGAQARRMLDDPRAHAIVADMHAQWLDVAHYSDLTRDATLFPAFSPALAGPMREETRRFVDDVVFARNGTLANLYTAPYTFVNDGLARIYGLTGSFGADFQRVDLPAAQRGGLFTQVGFLAAHAYPNSSDPIHRGVFIHKQVLCTVIGAPPPGAAMTPLPPIAGDVHTMRQRVSAQTSPPQCQSCHGFINPVGFGFENFDAVGEYRTMDNGEPVDTSGTVRLDGQSVSFHSAPELARAIAGSDTGRQCYVTQWFRYANQRVETATDRCTLDDLTARMRGDTYSIRDLLRDLTQTRAFMYRPAERM